MKKNKNIIESFNNAANGILQALKSERNMKLHIIAAALVIILSVIFGLTRVEFIIVCITIGMVLVCELINTALEALVDIITDEYHPKARFIKDVSAGAVLVSAFVSVIVAYFLFYDKISSSFGMGIAWVKQAPVHVTVISLIVTVMLVFVFKAITQRGTLFSGGMPSGHAAISFAITTALTVWTNNAGVAFFCFILSLLVVQSRLEAKIHSIIELAAGALLGITITLLLFKLFLL